jgi:hypothetical protein
MALHLWKEAKTCEYYKTSGQHNITTKLWLRSLHFSAIKHTITEGWVRIAASYIRAVRFYGRRPTIQISEFLMTLQPLSGRRQGLGLPVLLISRENSTSGHIPAQCVWRLKIKVFCKNSIKINATDKYNFIIIISGFYKSSQLYFRSTASWHVTSVS